MARLAGPKRRGSPLRQTMLKEEGRYRGFCEHMPFAEKRTSPINKVSRNLPPSLPLLCISRGPRERRHPGISCGHGRMR